MFDTEGSKYHPLFEHLLFSGQNELSMTFAEIERVIGASLPPSARSREEWWSNSPRGHSQARAWMRASYSASRVDLVGQTVIFKLDQEGSAAFPQLKPIDFGDLGVSGLGEGPQATLGVDAEVSQGDAQELREHPLFGIWVGQVKLLPGYDYTRPAFDPDEAE